MRAGLVRLRHLAVMLAPVGLGVADDGAQAIDRAVGGLHRHFGAAIAVEILHQELRVMRTCSDVATQVDPPQPFAA